MKKFLDNSGGLLLCLIEILVGVMLLINPGGLTRAIIVVLGGVLAVGGVVEAVRYFRMAPVQAAVSQTLLRGMVMLVVGCFCLFNSQWFIATFPILTMIYGVVILFSGLGKLQWTMNLLRLKNPNWHMAAVVAGLSLLCAVIILANPFATTLALWRFTGVFLVAEAVLDIVAIFISGRYTNRL